MIMCAAFLCGCGSQRELNSLMIVMGIGFDKDTENPSNLLLTSQLVLPEVLKAQGQGSTEKPYWNIQSSGEGTFDAIRAYSNKISSILYIAHTQVFIFGRSLAETGLYEPFDFFARAKETRPNTLLLISDTTAADLLNTDAPINQMPAMNLSKVVSAQKFTGETKEVTVLDYINTVLSKTTSFVAPLGCIRIEDKKKIPYVKGFAVFKGDKMVGEFTPEQSRGLMWVKDWVQSGIINIDVGGGHASLEISDAQSKVTPKIEGEKITIKLEIQASCTMGQQTTKENMATEENVKKMNKLAEQVIINEIYQSFEKAKQLNTDVFGFGEKINQTGTRQWPDMEKKWDTIFPKIDLQISVKAKITATGVIEKPVLPVPANK
jgi:spore germination protein KC